MNDEEKKIEKAFGGCKICYGKGYATTKMQAESNVDFGGEGAGIWDLEPVRTCSCDRGRALKQHMKRMERQGRIKELNTLRVHLDRQIMQESVNTASLYEYINSALKAL